jgi:hypothetical protein
MAPGLKPRTGGRRPRECSTTRLTHEHAGRNRRIFVHHKDGKTITTAGPLTHSSQTTAGPRPPIVPPHGTFPGTTRQKLHNTSQIPDENQYCVTFTPQKAVFRGKPYTKPLEDPTFWRYCVTFTTPKRRSSHGAGGMATIKLPYFPHTGTTSGPRAPMPRTTGQTKANRPTGTPRKPHPPRPHKFNCPMPAPPVGKRRRQGRAQPVPQGHEAKRSALDTVVSRHTLTDGAMGPPTPSQRPLTPS